MALLMGYKGRVNIVQNEDRRINIEQRKCESWRAITQREFDSVRNMFKKLVCNAET